MMMSTRKVIGTWTHGYVCVCSSRYIYWMYSSTTHQLFLAHLDSTHTQHSTHFYSLHFTSLHYSLLFSSSNAVHPSNIHSANNKKCTKTISQHQQKRPVILFCLLGSNAHKHTHAHSDQNLMLLSKIASSTIRKLTKRFERFFFFNETSHRVL